MNAHEYPTFANASGRRFGAEEEAAVTRVLRSGHLWRVDGPETAALEREFAELFGMPHAVAAATGSGVIHCAIAALDLEPGDQIIVPPITDAGSVIGALAQGLVPVFADVDPIAGCITPETVAAVATERTRAVVVVHLFGGAADVDGIVAWAAPRGIGSSRTARRPTSPGRRRARWSAPSATSAASACSSRSTSRPATVAC